MSILLILSGFQLALQQAMAATRIAMSPEHACATPAEGAESSRPEKSAHALQVDDDCCDHCCSTAMHCNGSCVLVVTTTLPPLNYPSRIENSNTKPFRITTLSPGFLPDPDFIPPR
ncbi:MAG TPA: hypothetical protein EYP40_09825 [Chromatiales bacterium]|nr:hypothetical protein [Chromatiales bacterium]